MSRRTLAAVAALSWMLLLPGGVIAQSAAQPAADQPKPKLDRNDPNFVICHRQQLSGLIPRYQKICKTRAQWIADSGRLQEDLEAAQNHGLINSCAKLTCP